MSANTVSLIVDNAELRRIVVSITQEEWKRLGIAAIKKHTSRNAIVRGALNDYFRKLSAHCTCIGGPVWHSEI